MKFLYKIVFINLIFSSTTNRSAGTTAPSMAFSKPIPAQTLNPITAIKLVLNI
jgi:hypothetical protein